MMSCKRIISYFLLLLLMVLSPLALVAVQDTTPKEVEAKSPASPVFTELPAADSISFFKSFMALTFVLGLIFLAAYLYKRVMGVKTGVFNRHKVPIRMIGMLPLGDKKFLAVIDIQGKQFFIGISHESINLISRLQLDLPDSDTEEHPGEFENIFKKALLLLNKGKK